MSRDEVRFAGDYFRARKGPFPASLQVQQSPEMSRDGVRFAGNYFRGKAIP